MSETSIDPTADPTIPAALVETGDLLTAPQLAWLELHARLSDYTTLSRAGTPPAQQGETEGGS